MECAFDNGQRDRDVMHGLFLAELIGTLLGNWLMISDTDIIVENQLLTHASYRRKDLYIEHNTQLDHLRKYACFGY